MFVGEHQHTLDEKGRVVLPAKFRGQLADGCVVTKGQDRCLFVFPVDRFEEEATRVSSLPRTDRRVRDFVRAFFASSDQQTLDRQGRLTIAAPLRDYAALTRDVTVTGAFDRIELWDSEAWLRVRDQSDQYYSDIEEALSEHGI